MYGLVRLVHVRTGWLALAAGLVAALTAAKPAHAQLGYPLIIDMTLGIDLSKIDPPSGCQLCHTDPAGGTASLTAFGNRMVYKYGLISTSVETSAADQSVVTALNALQADDPKLIEDLQMGMDPNPDTPAGPIPAYGCSSTVAPSRARNATNGAAGLVAAAVAAAVGRRRRRRFS
jgi:MYXO-CTERM domain-containing protein